VLDGYRLGGLSGVRVVFRDHAFARATGRASAPAEVALLREWIAEEVADGVAYWTPSLDGLRAEADAAEEPPSQAPGPLVPCTSCGALFGRTAGGRGRPRTRCYECSPPRS
jgi:hypothetical protein